MLAIIIYAFGIMYSPGPINLLSIHSGLNGQTKHHTGFFLGVSIAMFMLFMLLGYLGNKVITPALLPYMSLLGCSYIIYIAFKIFRNNVKLDQASDKPKSLSLWNGLFMQLLNPKGLIATLPIATIQFPAENIQGINILIWSVGLSVLAFGAPFSYSLAGAIIGKRVHNPSYFRTFNIIMSLLLVSVALNISYEHVYLALI